MIKLLFLLFFISSTVCAQQSIEPRPLIIKTQPEKATVMIDGVEVGTTDRNGEFGLFRLPGSYIITVAKEGYRPESKQIIVSGVSQNLFQFALSWEGATIILDINPIGAKIEINGTVVDRPEMIRVSSGPTQIQVSKSGYQPYSETVSLDSGQIFERKITLQIVNGTFQIVTSPLQANWVLRNDAGEIALSGTGLGRSGELQIGEYTLYVRADDHFDYVERLSIVSDNIQERNVQLEEVKSQLKFLYIAPERRSPSYERGIRSVYRRVDSGSLRSNFSTVNIVVDERGNVVNARVEREAGEGCDEYALLTIKDWKFAPEIQRGQPTRLQFDLPIRCSAY